MTYKAKLLERLKSMRKNKIAFKRLDLIVQFDGI